MNDLWQYLKKTDKPILLYGMGNGAQKIINTLDTFDIKVSGVFASDGFVRNKTFMGFKITDYKTAVCNYPDPIVLVAFGTQLNDVMDNIKRISNECELYAPDLPVIDGGLFDLKYYTSNFDSIEKIRNNLADDLSKKTFDNVIDFKLTGNIEKLISCESSPKEAFENIITPVPDGTFLDLGAYRGDTVAEYIKYSGEYRKIIAVEPDKKTFLKLVNNVPQDVICLNCAVTDRVGESTFDMQKGRNSRLGDGKTTIVTDTVDNILGGEKCDYIKMDVEGEEKNAINGAIQTIQNYKPKLCISAYHRAYDLVEIAEQVLGIRPDYKVYLRHFPYIPAWDTNYYFI